MISIIIVIVVIKLLSIALSGSEKRSSVKYCILCYTIS